jgi:hypothetical protein
MHQEKFLIDELENFDPNQPIYDDETDTYHEIRTIKLPFLKARIIAFHCVSLTKH